VTSGCGRFSLGAGVRGGAAAVTSGCGRCSLGAGVGTGAAAVTSGCGRFSLGAGVGAGTAAVTSGCGRFSLNAGGLRGAAAVTTGSSAIADGCRDGWAFCSGCGSQAGHCRTAGGISRPHSGQIQWNMPPMYPHSVFLRFRHTPYPTHLGTLSAIYIPSQATLSSRRETRPPRSGSGHPGAVKKPRPIHCEYLNPPDHPQFQHLTRFVRPSLLVRERNGPGSRYDILQSHIMDYKI